MRKASKAVYSCSLEHSSQSCVIILCFIDIQSVDFLNYVRAKIQIEQGRTMSYSWYQHLQQRSAKNSSGFWGKCQQASLHHCLARYLKISQIRKERKKESLA
jgi:hypothetical protein